MNTMRKYFALSMVALLALTLAIAAVGCGQKQEEAATPAPAETSTMASDSTAKMGGMADSTHSMMADTTAKK